ncbi:hypothetical protein [Bradyrhizobium sp. RDM12]
MPSVTFAAQFQEMRRGEQDGEGKKDFEESSENLWQEESGA